MSIHVTQHAVDRYIERVAPVTRDAAEAAIAAAERTIELAARFRAHTVRLGNGARLVITGVKQIRVVTVLGPRMMNRADMPKLGVVCCGGCGVRSEHPLAKTCIRVDCPLAAQGAHERDAR